jgi:hypothetical protein
MTRNTADEVYEKSARFARTVISDLQDGELPQVLKRDLRETYEFYLDQEEREKLAAMSPVQRWMVSMWWLVKSLFLKLTPTRRLILLVGMVLAADGVGVLGGSNTGNLLMGFLVLLFTLGLELKDKLLARDELEAGRVVQIALMPDERPEFEGWETWLHTEPANEVGGDLVDYQAVDDVRFSISLGDVAGKGLPAALFMAKLQATVRAVAPLCASLSELGARVNAIFCRDGLPGRFASLVYVEGTRGGDSVRILNAGHLPPVLVRRTGLQELERGAPALGLAGGTRYAERELTMEPGDILVAYSDGVTEARDESGEFFGEERLRRLLAGSHGRSAEEIGSRIVQAVADFCGQARPSDDLSIAVLRRRPVARSLVPPDSTPASTVG